MSHTDRPAPVNGSRNTGPAHTVEPNTNVRPAPNAQPAQAPRAQPSAPPSARPAQPPRTEAAPPRRQVDDRTANERPRVQGDAKGNTKAEQNDKSPRHG
jgi:hypothetical protein